MTDRARITRKYGDIVELARSREQDPGKTHWEGCESAHYECLIQCMADEIERLRAEVLDMREDIAGYRGLQADQANARCELLEMLKLERARVAELEAALDHYSGGASEALLRGALESISNGEGCGGLAETERLQEIARLALMKNPAP